MGRFYGKPTKFIKSVTDETITLGPQRAQIIPFWYYDDGATARTDGQNLTEKTMPLGSRITKHKVDMLVTPYTIEPQKLYFGMVKLSFNDVFAPHVCGTRFSLDQFQGTATDTNATTYLRLWPSETDVTEVKNGMSSDVDISGIDSVMLDDYFKHTVRLRKALVYDQRPLMTDRYMRVPSKVKRINEGTFYGMWIFNDSVRGATPADTQVDIRLKQYIEEWAL